MRPADDVVAYHAVQSYAKNTDRFDSWWTKNTHLALSSISFFSTSSKQCGCPSTL